MLLVKYLISLSLLFSQLEIDRAGQKCTIEILVVDQYGNKVKHFTANLMSKVDGVAYRYLPEAQIPVGRYEIAVEAEGFVRVKIEQVIEREGQLVVIPVRFRPDELSRVVTLEFAEAQPDCRLVSLIPAFGDPKLRLDLKLVGRVITLFDVNTGIYLVVRYGDDKKICSVSQANISIKPNQVIKAN
jgi:hypothetical protein